MRSLLLVVLALAACKKTPAPPPPAPSAAAPAPASASAPASAPAPAPILPTAQGAFYESLCPELENVTTEGASTPSKRSTGDVLVTAKTKTEKKVFFASIAVPSKKFDQEVFSMETDGDPFSCCSRATADGVDVTCRFSGIDEIEARGRARVEGSEVVVRWCKADLSGPNVMERGEKRVPLASGAKVAFAATTPKCTPRVQ